MRILHVLNDVTNRGNGIVNVAADVSMQQAKRGDTVAVASAGGEYESLLEAHGVTHVVLDQTRSLGNMIRAFFTFRRIVGQFRPDVVHVHMRTGLLLSWLWRPLLGFRLVSHIHNVHEKQSRMMGLAQVVIAVSDSVAGSMIEMGISRSKMRVVLNRILESPRLLPITQVTPAVLEGPSIVTVCGLFHRKGIRELIEAFELFSSRFGSGAHLYIVGDGDDRGDFVRQRELSPFAEFIHFEGFQSNPQAYMLAADVFVLASRRESFALVLVEARDAGCAIVATEVDGNPQALDYGRAGMLVPPQSPKELAEAFHLLLSNHELRKRLKRQARENLEQFTVHSMTSELDAIYREALHPAEMVPSTRTSSAG